MDEKSQPPEESSRPYRLQLITGTEKVLWSQSLPYPCHETGLDANAFWKDVRWQVFYAWRIDWGTPTSVDLS